MAKRGKQHVMIGGGRRGDVVSKLSEYERHGRDACQHTKSDVSSATQTQLHSVGPGVSRGRPGAAARPLWIDGLDGITHGRNESSKFGIPTFPCFGPTFTAPRKIQCVRSSSRTASVTLRHR